MLFAVIMATYMLPTAATYVPSYIILSNWNLLNTYTCLLYTSDVEKIAEIVHQYSIPLIVDEAHGAHFGFHPYFPENANRKGADVVIPVSYTHLQ